MRTIKRYIEILYHIKYNKDKVTFKDILDYIKFLSGVISGKIITGPLVVQFDVTNKCNNNCCVCWTKSPYAKKSKKDIEWDNYQLDYNHVISIIDDLYDIGTKKIFFAGGGEPFQHPHFLDILRHCKKLNFEVEFNTNFTLLNKDIVNELVNIGVDFINISVWAGDAKTYVATHSNKTKKSFDEIKSNLLLFDELKKKKNTCKPKLNIYNVLSAFNWDNLDAMMKFAQETKVEAIDFTPMDPIIGETDKFLLTSEQKKILAEQIQKYDSEGSPKIRSYQLFLNRMLHEGNEEVGEYDKTMIDNVPCYAGCMFIRIGAGGNVDPCLKAHKIPIGNVNKQSIKDIWWSHSAKIFRKKTKYINDKDPYFSLIGNVPDVKCGCYLSCDNIGYHQHLKDKILNQINPFEKGMLKFISHFHKEHYKK